MTDWTTAPNEPEYGDELDWQIQDIVAGLTGLDGSMVRPRWQQNPPATPDFDADWAAVAVSYVDADENPYIDTNGLVAHETIEALLSLYGPNGRRNAMRVIHGMKLPDNIATFESMGLYYSRSEYVRSFPELYNNQWMKRYDVTMTMRRKTVLDYAIDQYSDANVNVTPDAPGAPPYIEV